MIDLPELRVPPAVVGATTGGVATGTASAGAATGTADGEVRIGGLGEPGTVLLSGPGPGSGSESLAGHRARWGDLPGATGADVDDLLEASALDGRGGGGFPLARKVAAARDAGTAPVLVVNASESEPASGKDRALCVHRPHLVLDGAALAARALGAGAAAVHLHRGDAGPASALARAVEERRAAGVADPRWVLSHGPGRYVSGESSAVAAYLHDGDARPRFTAVPLAVRGPSGRPTVVTNAETVAHLAVVCRIGPAAWAGLGAAASPGTRLATVTGAVPEPGRVLELGGPPTVGEVLVATGVPAPPAAVLVGGYAGTWIDGAEAWQTPFERSALACLAASPGCGLVGVLPHGACGLTETSRLVRWLAGESAGQCGTCVAGLPRLADGLEALAGGRFHRRGLRRVEALGASLLGSGACGHPDAVVRLVRSTLDVFADDVVRHLAGAPCRGADHPPVLAVPAPFLPTAGPRPPEDFT